MVLLCNVDAPISYKSCSTSLFRNRPNVEVSGTSSPNSRWQNLRNRRSLYKHWASSTSDKRYHTPSSNPRKNYSPRSFVTLKSTPTSITRGATGRYYWSIGQLISQFLLPKNLYRRVWKTNFQSQFSPTRAALCNECGHFKLLKKYWHPSKAGI